MQFCGIICEFNPFHNGHKYLIEKAKHITNEPVVCLMSGEFVQRGTPAIQEKYSRAKTAIECGADCVLELPTIFACSNAENFAMGAVRILDKLKASHLAFGVEKASLEVLQKIAGIKYKNSIEFQNCFKNEIENGINYNTALKRAIAKELGSDNTIEILSKPNNILAIEYLTAIKKLGSKIIPVAIERVDNGYSSNKENGKYLSASGIRQKLKNNEDVKDYLPNPQAGHTYFTKKQVEVFETIALLKLRTSSAQELEKCYDYSEGIEFRILKQAEQATSLSELIDLTTTPRYRKPRIQKLVIYPLLNITKSLEKQALRAKPAVKVLAIKKSFKLFLASSNKNCINLITTNKDYDALGKIQRQIIDIDLCASNMYNTIQKTPNNNDKKQGTLFL